MQYGDRRLNTDWQCQMFKRGKDNGHDIILGINVNFKVVFLIFCNKCLGTH